jgi:hypothetical protein
MVLVWQVNDQRRNVRSGVNTDLHICPLELFLEGSVRVTLGIQPQSAVRRL